MATAHVWYRALNCGFRLPAGAGTDAMANFASLRGPVGMNRVYVRTGGALDQRRLLDSLQGRDGRSRPTARCSSSRSTGAARARSSVSARGDARGACARVSLRSNVAVDHLEIVGNGEVVAGDPASPATARAPTSTVRLPVRGERLVPAARPELTGPSIRCSTSIPMRRRARSTSRSVGRRCGRRKTRSISCAGSIGSRRRPRPARTGTRTRNGKGCWRRSGGRGRSSSEGNETPASYGRPTAVQSPSRSPVPRRCTW